MKLMSAAGWARCARAVCTRRVKEQVFSLGALNTVYTLISKIKWLFELTTKHLRTSPAQIPYTTPGIWQLSFL